MLVDVVVAFMAVIVTLMIMTFMIVAFVCGIELERGIGRFRVGVVFESVGRAQRFAFQARIQRQLICRSG